MIPNIGRAIALVRRLRAEAPATPPDPRIAALEQQVRAQQYTIDILLKEMNKLELRLSLKQGAMLPADL